MTVDPRRLCQIEIPAFNLDESLKFYREVFNWQQVPIELHQYIVLETPEACSFGISLLPCSNSQKVSTGITIYFQVDRLDTYLAKARSFDPALVKGQRKLPGYGLVQIIKDPSGNRLGLFETPH